MVRFITKNGKKIPIDDNVRTKSSGNNDESGGMKIGNGTRVPKNTIKADNIDLRELRDHPMFEESSEWLDVFSETPEVIVADDRRNLFYIWFGGESHYVHEYTVFGNEMDVFSFGFDKNRLDEDEVLEQIEDTLNEPLEDEE